ncbi:MAG: ABC transporter substrate-binding protein [Phycisphaeraceae bacterium]|nr:ABC transporter substrate-binding protein [Phycisphaeraceae bacterium]
MIGFLGLLSILLAGGCEPSSSSPPVADDSLRVVSLAPSISRYVVDLGLGDRIVGKGEHDRSAPADVPVVGSIMNIQAEPLLAVDPNVVLVTAGAGGVPPRLTQLAGQDQFVLHRWSYPSTVEESLNQLSAPAGKPDLPPDLGEVLGRPEDAKQLRTQIEYQLTQLNQKLADQPRPKVLLAFGYSPWMAAGPGSVLDDLLTRYLHADNAVGDAPISAPTLDREGLVAAAPDVIILLQPGGRPLKPLAEDDRLAALRGLDIPAVNDQRIYLVDDPECLLPSSNLPRTARQLAKRIHGAEVASP